MNRRTALPAAVLAAVLTVAGLAGCDEDTDCTSTGPPAPVHVNAAPGVGGLFMPARGGGGGGSRSGGSRSRQRAPHVDVDIESGGGQDDGCDGDEPDD